MTHTFWKDGDYEARGGIYIRNELFKFFETLSNKGLNPVGIQIDDSWNMQIIVERNEAYIENYEKLNSDKNDERSVATKADSSNSADTIEKENYEYERGNE